MKKVILLLLVVIVNISLVSAVIKLEYNETDLVTLKPKAADQDADKLDYTYSAPLDKDGKWQTDYGDSGEYPVTVTVSDGELSSSQEVLLIINKKDIAPSIIDFNPAEEMIDIDEGTSKEFSIGAMDLNKDSLSYQWKVDGKTAGREKSFIYKAGYEDSGLHKLEVMVSDGVLSDSHNWDLRVADIDRSSVLDQIADIEVWETEVVELELPDFGKFGLNYIISEPVGNDNYWETGYGDAGVHYVRVTIRDEDFEDFKDIKVTVKNKDMPLYFQDIKNAVMRENQKVLIYLEANDPDGDPITYSVENAPEGSILDRNLFSWQPNYDTVKKESFIDYVMDKLHILRKGFVIRFKAKSNDIEVKRKVKITVLDVNRAPVITAPESILVNEGEEIKIEAEVNDLDNDRVTVRYGGFMDNEYYLSNYEDSGEYTVTIVASDGELETQKDINVVIADTNRLPVFNDIRPREINEGDELKIKLVAFDHDGDNLIYSNGNIPDARIEGDLFIWQPDFDVVSTEEGNREIVAEFIISDGEFNVTQTANITVYNTNRGPEITNTSPAQNIIAFKDNPVLFVVDAIDEDNDKLTYLWKFKFYEKFEASAKHQRTFTTLGNKKIEVTVSDGFEEVSHLWNVKVMDYEEYKNS